MDTLKRQTIGSLLKSAADRFPHREAVVYSELDLRYSYQELFEETAKIAKGLMALGIQKSEHVAIWASNIPEWILLQFATARIGAVLVTVNTSYQARELEYLLEHSDSTTLFLMDGYKGTSYIDMIHSITGNQEALPKLERLVYLGHGETPENMISFADLSKKGEFISDDALFERERSLSPDDVINMQYTSGTTGFPKGVMLTHYNIVNNAAIVADRMGLTNRDRLCIPVPLFHCFGCVLSTLACVSAGAAMLPIIEFKAETVLQTVEQERCTGLQGVPTMFIAELSHPHFADYDLSSLRTGIMAGSPCPKEVMKKVMKQMNLTDITIAYGQTESSPVITQTTITDTIERRVETVGKVHPHVEIKIIDPETGRALGPHEQGELCTRGYLVMKGYYKMEEATRKAIDKDGWLLTGDLAEMDQDGYVRITGRLKDMIVRGGENIYPREIEEFLYEHEDIVDVQVVGVPDEKYGEKTAAFIKCKPGKTLSLEDVRTFCKGQLSYYKIPEYVFQLDEYPLTASGKVQKYILRDWATDMLAATAE
ncbi:AMP-binding protein [Bacillus sonorensis]|uniref:AMP-binding protein n=1 Tax=Bacillus sonorensis TaxID=119858 RepID=UPI002DBB6A24|nr:AMP-binding protein [Bacillus sonorensis]MEC1352760.1 AMP-binding protein [Bacillus sonorensis]MEC1426376.1 AMP-binding protein [Bacillus sonorensis]